MDGTKGTYREADRRETGLTMVELLVTVVISTLFFAAMVPVFVMASQQSSGDRARILATNTVQSVIEGLRDLSYDDVYDTHWSNRTEAQAALGQDFNWKGSSSDITVSVSPYPSTATVKGTEKYLIATVTAMWNTRGKSHSTTMKTAIYRQGLASETLVLLVYDLTGGYIQNTPVTVSAQLNAADAAQTQRIDFTIYANNGTRIEDWSVYTSGTAGDGHLLARDDGSGTFYYDHPWYATANGQPGGTPLPDGHYSFVAKTVPLQPTNGDTVPAAEWARKEYILNRTWPGSPILEDPKTGFYKSSPSGDKQPFVYLQWHLDVNISDVDHFQVTRTTTAVDGSLLTRSITVPKWATEYVDRDVATGKTYTYKVGAQDTESTEPNAYSDPKDVTLSASDLGLVPNAPTGPIKYVVSGRSVSCSWGPSSTSAVDAYRLYRVGADGANLLVETVTVDPGTTDPTKLTFRDIFVDFGQTYTYFVTALIGDSGGFQWESPTLSGAPVMVPEPPKVGMRVSIQVKAGVDKPKWARLMIHDLDTGNLIPANPWEYPLIDVTSSNVNQNTWITGNILYPGSYQVIAVFYSKKNTLLGSATSDTTYVSAPDTVVYVPYLGPTTP